MIYMPASEQLADLLTKALTRRPRTTNYQVGHDQPAQLEGDHWKLESNII